MFAQNMSKMGHLRTATGGSQSLAILSSSPAWKKERQQSILRTASAVITGGATRAMDRTAIKAIISKCPAKLESVVELKAQLKLPKNPQHSAVKARLHDAVEQEAAQSEGKALNEALRSDSALYEGHHGRNQIYVAGYNCRRPIIIDLANLYEKKPYRSKTLQGPFNRHLWDLHICRMLLSTSC